MNYVCIVLYIHMVSGDLLSNYIIMYEGMNLLFLTCTLSYYSIGCLCEGTLPAAS